MENDQRVMFQITTEQKKFLSHFSRFEGLINRLLMRNEEIPIYVEFLENGILYIIDNMEVFQRLAQPFTPDVNLNFNPEQRFLDKIALKVLYPKKDFPSDGFQMNMEILSDSKDLGIILKKYFLSINKDIVYNIIDEKTCNIFFPTYQTFMMYLNAFAISCKFFEQTVP
jgi:hypothetical protein